MTTLALVTIDEARDAYRVEGHVLYRAVKAGKIAAYKPGKRLLLDAGSLQDWFESTRVRPKRRMGRPRNTTITNI